MTETKLSLESDGLKVEPVVDGTLPSAGGTGKPPLALRFTGSADTRSLSALEDLLLRVHDAATEQKAEEVALDLRSMKFISSSCLKAFVVWLSRVQALAADRQYRIRFFADDSKPWQRRCLGAVACFAVDLVKIDSGAASV